MEKTYTRENGIYPNSFGNTRNLRYTAGSMDSFTFFADPEDNSLLTVTKNGQSKTVLVDDVRGKYFFRLMPSRIKARGGAKGLAVFMERALDENFMACYAWGILDYAMTRMKPACKQ